MIKLNLYEASKISGGLPTGNLLALHRTLPAVGNREARVTCQFRLNET